MPLGLFFFGNFSLKTLYPSLIIQTYMCKTRSKDVACHAKLVSAHGVSMQIKKTSSKLEKAPLPRYNMPMNFREATWLIWES